MQGLHNVTSYKTRSLSKQRVIFVDCEAPKEYSPMVELSVQAPAHGLYIRRTTSTQHKKCAKEEGCFHINSTIPTTQTDTSYK